MSYISSLNLLNADSPAPINEEVFQDDLALWANAQFSFDTTPGSALGDEDKKDEDLFETLSKLAQLVQPNTIHQNNNEFYPQSAILPRIAPAPGPTSALQLLENNNMMLSNNKKRNVSDVIDDGDLSIDDDKRRRNTAASARFRMKKKLREQALEKTTKEMADNVEKLESKVKELEMEAKWLRALVVEKDPKLLDKETAATENS
ncbi:uncharacterized protein EV154DRAFT_525664 [Mucor mucedo]|uniref:uncharacterized protein n=1 Tax=Mucor mucedo TaxID=29922 RepID=UPI00221ED475|nr:uncharacterized protein EV154DRAFT_525664 [Mucor mucedo]KAI7876783.1 hypothetical protein EV154DRAFT_525664 [Mucor mucedo]